MKKNNFLLAILLLGTIKPVLSQSDSIRLIPVQAKINSKLDSVINDLKGRNSKNIIVFFAFGFTAQGGAVVWDENGNIKCMKVTYEKDKFKTKRLSNSKIHKELFYDAWKNPVFVELLRNGKHSYISNDINLYVRVTNSSLDKEVRFKYSNYLGNKNDKNIDVLKEIMNLVK
jgi:hypothetical protein